MKWTRGYESGNVEDRRGSSVRRGGMIGLGGLLLLLLLSWATGTDFLSLLGPSLSSPSVSVDSGGPVASTPEEDALKQFVSFVLDDAQDTWRRQLGPEYRNAKLVLFRDAIDSACGFAQSATGPFYCPADEKVYIDLSFYDELKQRFGASGDFAQAYVLAHEIGHHVQKVIGVESQVRQLQQSRPDAANQLSVRMELQADCFAGVWGHDSAQRDLLERGDVEEGLNAAAAIGDDRIQRMGGGRVQPESFTHGSSAQREQWFRRGLDQGSVDACDTFGRRGESDR